MTSVGGGSFSRTALFANHYETKTHDSSMALTSISSADLYEVKRAVPFTLSLSQTSSLVNSEASKKSSLLNLGIQLLKPFDELNAVTGMPVCLRMPLCKFVDWLASNNEALNECAYLTEQAETITAIFKSNLADRAREIVPLVPCMELSEAKGQKKGDFPKVVLVPFNECHHYLKEEGGYFSKEALPEANEVKQRILSTKAEVDAIVREAAKSTGITWGYRQEGCELRAASLYQALRCMGIASNTMFFQYYVGSLKRFGWRFHVALAIKLSTGQLLVLDPSFDSNAAMTVEEWIRKFHDDEEYKLTTNNQLEAGKCREQVFHTSCDRRFENNTLIRNDYNFFRLHRYRLGLFDVILKLMNLLANAPSLFALLKEVQEDYRILWLLPAWIEFENHGLLASAKSRKDETRSVFNFTLEEIKTLKWHPLFEGRELIDTEALVLLECAIKDCREMTKLNIKTKSYLLTKKIFQKYVNALLQKVRELQNA